MVTNDRESMFAERIRLASDSSRAGESWIRDSDSTSPFNSAMYSAAEVPLPETSATSTPIRVGPSGSRS
jgi:hypothetical protein